MQKKSAIPEYIWYISLIIIAIVLVTTVVSLVNKAKKNNVELPDIQDAKLVIYTTPTGELRIGTIEVLGIKKEELNKVYLYCEGKAVPLNEIFNISLDFARTPNNYIELNKKDYLLNLTKYNFSENCENEGAKWVLFLGNPIKGGIKITDTQVEFRSSFW